MFLLFEIRCQRANPSTPAPGPTPGKRKVSPLESLRAHQEAAQASMRLTEAGGLPTPSCVTGSLNLAAPDLRLPVPAQVLSIVSSASDFLMGRMVFFGLVFFL